MKAKVMETIKNLGFNIVSTGSTEGAEDALIYAEREDLRISTWVTSESFSVQVYVEKSAANEAYFRFMKGELPNMSFRAYTPEMFEIARRFGAVAGCKI